ncbi:hypothetical protein N7466_001765 [Penicillium verhagenii]|uniref:uncharacterized protein n=1 Tax=Penicillium verhagenii TaxID=1562060 RepID=UPI002545AB67|nr:uncharacterized protein N7466_001765 [Penicillium verhagenii]KAJ5938631.1 hypothetical protein N7466_001765 [Penicillium verhagenii]
MKRYPSRISFTACTPVKSDGAADAEYDRRPQRGCEANGNGTPGRHERLSHVPGLVIQHIRGNSYSNSDSIDIGSDGD